MEDHSRAFFLGAWMEIVCMSIQPNDFYSTHTIGRAFSPRGLVWGCTLGLRPRLV